MRTTGLITIVPLMFVVMAILARAAQRGIALPPGPRARTAEREAIR